jgi:isopentenyl-diphosphate delta-isomerase
MERKYHARLVVPGGDTEERKARHIDVVLEEDVTSHLDVGFDSVRLRHEALPEIALDEVDISTTFLGKSLRAPFVISSMTGGTPRAAAINRNLALGAEAAGIALGLGSQRAALEDRRLVSTYDVRRYAPSVPLYANLGAVQLNYGVTADDTRRAVDEIQADGLYLHLNPLQEAIQRGGDTNFRDLAAKIEHVVRTIGVPVLVKGVGSGISVKTARRLLDMGVAAVDVAGAGGTSWARVEGRRSGEKMRERIGESFAGWGYPTAHAVVALRHAFPDAVLVASGGLRTGVHAAKSFALGADLAGFALPFLQAASESAEAVHDLCAVLTDELRIACFASGCATIGELRSALQTPTSVLGL